MKCGLVFMVLLGLLTGCSSAPTEGWKSANGAYLSPNQYQVPVAKCRMEMRKDKVDKADFDAAVQDCMEAQGYKYFNRSKGIN